MSNSLFQNDTRSSVDSHNSKHNSTDGIGLGINNSRSSSSIESNPWNQVSSPSSSGTVKPAGPEDSIRPLRLAKRHSIATSNHSSTPTRVNTNTSSATPTNDEFKCRPIRLGSRNKSNENHDPTNDDILSSAASTPARSYSRRHSGMTIRSLDDTANKHKSFNPLLNSTISNNNNPHIKLKEDTEVIPSVAPAIIAHNNPILSTPNTSNRNSLANSSSSVSSPSSVGGGPSSPSTDHLSVGDSRRAKRKSIQIKNLPIIHSPKSIDVTPNTAASDDMIFAICLVDFHHVRGPEIQWWKSNYHPVLEDDHKLFKNLPFQALPDGSHLFEETFSNFNLVYDFERKISLDELKDIEAFDSSPNNLKTLFGCSCVRQVKTSDLSSEERERHKDITRSIVQKAVVVIVRKQPIFTKIKEKLSIITKSYFQQDDFDNTEILEHLFDNLNDSFKLVESEDEDADDSSNYNSARLDDELREKLLLESKNNEREEEFFVNLNINQTILKFKSNFLVIFKALLLEKKVLVFSNNNLEMLTQFQNNLISLIPNLINNLDFSGCPLSDYTEAHPTLSKPHSLNTNDRQSMLRFFGLPLQIFNTKNNFWNPYLPLQQLDQLKIKSFMAGCSNLLFVNQAENFNIDLVVNLDTNELSFPNGKSNDLNLSSSDKKFINNLIISVNKDDERFVGNDDYIRYQFEDYLSGLVATTRFKQYTERFKSPPPGFDTSTNPEFGNVSLFNDDFIKSWKDTQNYHIWDRTCDEFIFNFQDPKHISVGLVDNQPYAITTMFSNWKNKFNQQPQDSNESSPSNSLNVTNSGTVQPQKYIPDDGFIMVNKANKDRDTETLASSVTSPSSNTGASSPSTVNTATDSIKKAGGWNWGFKKK